MTKTLLNIFKIIIPIFLLFVSLDFSIVLGIEGCQPYSSTGRGSTPDRIFEGKTDQIETLCFRSRNFARSLIRDNVSLRVPYDNAEVLKLFNIDIGDESYKEDTTYSTTSGLNAACIYMAETVGKCKNTDILAPVVEGDTTLRVDDNKVNMFCGSSYNEYNKIIGQHCIANLGRDSTYEVCGIGLPINDDNGYPIELDNQELKEFQVCTSPYPYCISTNNEEGDITKGYNTKSPDLATDDEYAYDTMVDYPQNGICMNCVGSVNDDNPEGKECEIIANDARASEMLIRKELGIYDNCCDTDFYCKPSSTGAATGTCTKKEDFTYCSGNNDFISPGGICNFIYDDTDDFKNNDKCDLCATTGATTKDDEGNDLCPEIAYDPTLDVVTSGCRSECGCPTTREQCIIDATGQPICEDFGVEYYCQISSGSNTGSCTLNECVPDGEKATGNLECCNDNSTINEKGICEVNCSEEMHSPGEKCINACCEEGFSCNNNKQCSDISSICFNNNGCCGNYKICSDGECIDANNGECAPNNKSRPPKGGYPRPQAGFSLDEFITVVISILYPLSVILAMIFIVVGGYKLMISKGDPKGVKQAQETLTNAILGLIFIILSATLLRFVLNVILNV